MAERSPMPHLIVVLPGIMGSTLQKDGKDVWGVSPAAIMKGLFSGGRALDVLTVVQDPVDAEDLGDGIMATSLIPFAHLVPGLWAIDGYSELHKHLLAQFKLEPGQNYFELPYDWRRDIRVAARKLQTQVRKWLPEWRVTSGNQDAKLILIGHSMGGLVARHYLECMEGWKCTDKLITLGTPHRGSLKALHFLVNGFHKGWGKLSIDLSRPLRSFTSVYQLLATYNCYDQGTGKFEPLTQVTLPPVVDKGKVAAGAQFHADLTQAVQDNLKSNAYASARYLTKTFIGVDQPTLQAARAVGGETTFLNQRDKDDLPGDSTVPRGSTIPVENDREDAEYSPSRHASLHNDPAVVKQIDEILRGGAMDPGKYRAEVRAAGIGLSLDVNDAYLDTEPLDLAVTSKLAFRGHLAVTAENVDDPLQVVRGTLTERNTRRREGTLGTLPEGVYRLTVGGPDARPLTELVSVVSAAATA
jgi:pimeloyl-ACP methyl ester carboxylesterase